MPPLLIAALAGLASGLALVAGAAVAWFVAVPRWLVAAITAFGAGVLISALAFDLVEEARSTGGFGSAMAGFLAGAVVYVLADKALDRIGARSSRSRGGSGGSGTGIGIALGALLDGIPETAVQGLGLATGGSLSIAVVAAVIVSNIPEGLSSTADMRRDGRGARSVFLIWGGIAFACTVSAVVGFALLGQAPDAVSSFVTAIAAGAILAMLADTMLPDAYRETKAWTGLLVVLGFFASYGIHELGG